MTVVLTGQQVNYSDTALIITKAVQLSKQVAMAGLSTKMCAAGVGLGGKARGGPG